MNKIKRLLLKIIFRKEMRLIRLRRKHLEKMYRYKPYGDIKQSFLMKIEEHAFITAILSEEKELLK